MRRLLLLFGVVGIFGWSDSVLLPAYATDVLHVAEGGYSALLSANGFGALLGALTVATFGNRVKPRLLIFGGLWLFSFTLMLLAVVRWYPLVLLCLAVSGWGMMLYFATTNTLVQSSVSNAMRGRVMGIWALVFGGMMPLGGLESGFFPKWSEFPGGGRRGLGLRRRRPGHVVAGPAPSRSSRRNPMMGRRSAGFSNPQAVHPSNPLDLAPPCPIWKSAIHPVWLARRGRGDHYCPMLAPAPRSPRWSRVGD